VHISVDAVNVMEAYQL